MLDAYALKHRYSGKWLYANAREYYILSLVNLALPAIIKKLMERTRLGTLKTYLAKARVEARLTGLGAGSTEYLDRTYSGLEEAFDITVYVDGDPCCWVDATGVELVDDLKEGLGYCAATWKLRKAKKYEVLDRTWFAFVINETGTAKFLRASWLAYHLEAESPRVTTARLREDEREAACTSPRNWLSKDKFLSQLQTALYKFIIKRKLG